MNVAKGSRVRLLTKQGEIEYGVHATVTLHHFIEMLRRLEALDSVRSDRCTGASSCVAPTHAHGCFADLGSCDDPNDHPEPDEREEDR